MGAVAIVEFFSVVCLGGDVLGYLILVHIMHYFLAFFLVFSFFLSEFAYLDRKRCDEALVVLVGDAAPLICFFFSYFLSEFIILACIIHRFPALVSVYDLDWN